MTIATLRCALGCVATLIAAAACGSPDSIVESGPTSAPELSMARAAAGPSYTAQEVGTLAGDAGSWVNGVNNLGYVVGVSTPPAPQPAALHAFLKTGATMRMLSPNGSANAVSSGSPIYVAGYDQSADDVQNPTRWTYDVSTGTVTEHVYDVRGSAVDINDAGTMVGTTSDISDPNAARATVWPIDGTPITIEPLAGYARSTGRGINNAGHVAVNFYGAAVRAHLIVDGTPIELPPAAGHTMTFAGEVGEPVNGIVYASGISAGNVENDYHLARWKIDVVNKTVVSVEARREVSEGGGISDDGTAAGQIEGKQSSSGIAWTLAGTIALKPTKGGTAPTADDISSNGRFIVGSAIYRLSSRALIWTRTP